MFAPLLCIFPQNKSNKSTKRHTHTGITKESESIAKRETSATSFRSAVAMELFCSPCCSPNSLSLAIAIERARARDSSRAEHFPSGWVGWEKSGSERQDKGTAIYCYANRSATAFAPFRGLCAFYSCTRRVSFSLFSPQARPRPVHVDRNRCMQAGYRPV